MRDKIDFSFEELIDFSLLQDLQEKLNEIYSFPSAIIDNEGNILTAVAWQDICTKFHRKHPECEKECIKSDKYILEHLPEANPAVSYQCPHGLIDNATPIIIDGHHLANFFTGQFFLEEPDIEYFRKQAQKYGFNEKEYLEAVMRVPVWSKEKLSKYLDFIKGFIEVIAGIGYKNLIEKETNKKLRQQEEKFQNIIQTSSDGYWLINKKGKILEVNKTYSKMSGYSESELLTMSVSDFEVIDTEQMIEDHIHSVITNGNDRFYSKHRKKDGSSYHVEVSVQNISYRDDIIVVFIRDISDNIKYQKEIIEAKEKAEEREKEISLLFENMVQGFALHKMIYDENGKPVDYRFIKVNKSFEKLTGLKTEEIIGKTVREVLPETEQIWIDNYGKVASTRESMQFENFARGINRYYSVIAYSPKKDFFAVVFTDITDAKNQERQLIEAKEMAEENEHFLIESQKAGNIGSYITELPSGEWKISGEMYNILGIDKAYPHNLKGFLDLIHPDSLDDFKAYHNKVESEKSPFDYEYKIVRYSDKAERWVHGKGELELDEMGNSVRRIGTIQDITERKEAANELEKYREELEEIVKERTKQLEENNAELERINKLFVGREFRIKELRDKVKDLEKEIKSENDDQDIK